MSDWQGVGMWDIFCRSVSRSLFHYAQTTSLLTKPVKALSYISTYPIVQPHHSLVCKNKLGCGFLGAFLCLAHQLEKIHCNGKSESPIHFVECHGHHYSSNQGCTPQQLCTKSGSNALLSNTLQWLLFSSRRISIDFVSV